MYENNGYAYNMSNSDVVEIVTFETETWLKFRDETETHKKLRDSRLVVRDRGRDSRLQNSGIVPEVF